MYSSEILGWRDSENSKKRECKRDISAASGGKRRTVGGGEFWEDGYFVRTVGTKVTSERIKK